MLNQPAQPAQFAALFVHLLAQAVQFGVLGDDPLFGLVADGVGASDLGFQGFDAAFELGTARGAHAIAPDAVTVVFRDGGVYVYVYVYEVESAGRSNIEQMKALANAGSGLSTFIVRHVRQAFTTRLA